MPPKNVVAIVLAITGSTIANLNNAGKTERQNPSCLNDSLKWISTNTSLPKVVRLDNVNYGSGYRPTVEDLIGNVSEVLNVAQLAVVQFDVRGGSSGINSSLYLNISQYANRQLCSKESNIAGAVMLHGTNTLEETASSLTTGAMRPDSYVSPDGRSNFYQAVAAAVSPSSRNRGGLIVFNDSYTTKTNANTPDTFKAIEQGNLGVFLAGQPFYYFGASYPTGRPYFDVTNTTELPPVVILYGHQGFDASLMYAAVANGAKGLVFMGPGAAQLSPSAYDVAVDLYSRGIPTVAVARTVTGTGIPESVADTLIYSSYQIATLSRIMLQLSINAGHSINEIRALFENPLRQAVYKPWVNQQAYGLAA
ncbi:hypothetical protein CHU98_g1919 [Xylaria longipes]|nr:hypothetical protein CHU98_g1919 [Xylaria longipes]